MITVSEVVARIIKDSPFLEEGVSNGLINFSSLARKMKPEIEKITFKPVTVGAIVMSLKRLSSEIRRQANISQIIQNPDLLVRSNLIEYTVKNSDLLVSTQIQLLEQIAAEQSSFLILTQNIYETTIIASSSLKETIAGMFKSESIISHFDNLSAVTIKLPEETIHTPGAYYHILKLLAWDNINLIEVTSSYTEFTIILDQKDVDRAFSVLKNGLTNNLSVK